MLIQNCPIHMNFCRFTTLSTSASVFHSPAFLTASFAFQDQLHCHCVSVMQNAPCHQTMLHLSTRSILTQVGSSLKTSVIKPSFKGKRGGKAEDLVLLQCQCQSLPYIYTADIKDKLHFLCQKSLIFCYFLLQQHLCTSLLIANLGFQLCGAGHLLFFHVTNLPHQGRVSTKGLLFCNCFQDLFL